MITDQSNLVPGAFILLACLFSALWANAHRKLRRSQRDCQWWAKCQQGSLREISTYWKRLENTNQKLTVAQTRNAELVAANALVLDSLAQWERDHGALVASSGAEIRRLTTERDRFALERDRATHNVRELTRRLDHAEQSVRDAALRESRREQNDAEFRATIRTQVEVIRQGAETLIGLAGPPADSESPFC